MSKKIKIFSASAVFVTATVGALLAKDSQFEQNVERKYVFFDAALQEKKISTSDKRLGLFTFEHNSSFVEKLSSKENTFYCWHTFVLQRGNFYRPYTPFNLSDNTFDFLIKDFGSGAYFSPLFQQLEIGQKLNFFGPQPLLKFELHHDSHDLLLSTTNIVNQQKFDPANSLLLLCSGTGLAPMIQISNQLADSFPITLVVFSLSSENLDLQKLILDKIEKKVDVIFVCKELKSSINVGTSMQGFINADSLRKILAYDRIQSTVVIVCGNDSFLNKLCGAGHRDGEYINQPKLSGILESLGFKSDQVFRL